MIYLHKDYSEEYLILGHSAWDKIFRGHIV